MSRRRKIGIAFAVALVGALVYLLSPLVLGAGDMREFCRSLRPGATQSEVRAAASARGFRVSAVAGDRAFVHDPRSFGRFVCALRVSGDALESASFEDND
jgi:hypothetical protein